MLKMNYYQFDLNKAFDKFNGFKIFLDNIYLTSVLKS